MTVDKLVKNGQVRGTTVGYHSSEERVTFQCLPFSEM